MVCSNEINLGEDLSSMKRRGKVLKVRNGIAVRDRYPVQCSIVATWAPVTGGLLGYHV